MKRRHFIRNIAVAPLALSPWMLASGAQKTTFGLRLGEGDGSDADVLVGSTTGKFLPNFNASKWGDEYWLNLNYSGMRINKEEVEVTGNKLAIIKGSEKLEAWPYKGSVLEAAIVFAAKPVKTQLEFSIANASGMDFWPQGSQFDILLPGETISRPPNVEGSIAVYASGKGLNLKGGPLYKTGKLAHLYRWECIDALGQKAWCDPLQIDGNKLIIPLPVDWLKKAVYPVRAMGAGDTFGYDTIGAGSASYSGGIMGYAAAPSSDGTATDIYIYTMAATTAYTFGLYDTSDNLLGDTAEGSVTVTTWDNLALDSGQSISNGTTYRMALFEDTSTHYAYDNGGTSGAHTNDHSYVAGVMPDPITWDSSTYNRIISTYTEYTPGSAASVVPALMQIGEL